MYIVQQSSQNTHTRWNARGVTRHLSHEMWRDWVHENEIRFFDFSLKSSTMNGKVVFYSTEKHKKMVHFEMNLFFMKLNFFFNDLYAVIATCKLELHDSG